MHCVPNYVRKKRISLFVSERLEVDAFLQQKRLKLEKQWQSEGWHGAYPDYKKTEAFFMENENQRLGHGKWN